MSELLELLEIGPILLDDFDGYRAEGVNLVTKGSLLRCFLIFFLSSNERSRNLTMCKIIYKFKRVASFAKVYFVFCPKIVKGVNTRIGA